MHSIPHSPVWTRVWAGWVATLMMPLASFVGEAGAAAPAGGAARVSFSREVQPLLSEYCYQCHGPDASTRKPKKNPFRIDRAQQALLPREDGKPAILKGDPKGSSVVQRMRSMDAEEIMPPPSAHKTMKPAEIALIERWIAEGADYEEHWAFVPPRRVTPPSTGPSTGPSASSATRAWARGPVDQFVAARLAAAGLTPNGEESKRRLLRRVTLDLTGLPPTPAELEAFERDASPAAYERAVDRLLASDASAEHFARFWLDAVRYADTQGIHHDHYRPVWPYRDWVVSAFRTNMPFDQFTIEQLAGDLLPGATLDQKVASGYNRLLPTTGEGGAIPEEYNAIYAKDRVDTTSAVWLGLTAGCASCHDHKFDPVSTRDFYSMTAFFRNNTLRALDDGGGRDFPPTVFVPAPGDRARWPELQAALAVGKTALEARRTEARPDFERWLADARPERWKAPKSGLLLHLPLDEAEGPARGTARGRSAAWAGPTNAVSAAKANQSTNAVGGGLARGDGLRGRAPVITGTGQAVQGREPVLRRDGRFSVGGFLRVEGKPSGAVVSRMNVADKYRGWDLFLTDGRPTVHIVDQFPDAALKVTAKEALPPGRWRHVMAVFDGTRPGASALSLYVDGRPVAVEVNNDRLGSNIVAEVPVRIGGRSDGADKTAQVMEKGKVWLQDLRVYDRALEPLELAQLAAAWRVADYLARPASARGTNDTAELYELFLGGFDAPGVALRGRQAALQAEEATLRARGGISLIMEEKKDTEPVAHVLTRGNYLTKGDAVKAAIPEVFGSLPEGAPRNRLGLARWLVAPGNPLTARVTANRVWQQLFGVGLVETAEDFGIMGARPTHPELLDWLALDFAEGGWNHRHLVKTIVMSATYRQSATATPEKLEKDPLNRLLSRGPRGRLDAEVIRDQALAASGLLVRRLGGPPVKPYQPEGVWESVAMKDSNTRFYRQDTGDALHRRSLYTFWKRIAPPPSLEILNAPSREVFCVRRERSNTPLQALVTMNDPQFVEAARHLATRALRVSRRFDARLDALTVPLLGRRLDPAERPIVQRTVDRALAAYRADPPAAKALITVGETAPDPGLAAAELAAWTLAASQILNLDEALTR